MRHLKLLHYSWKIPLIVTVVVLGCLAMAAVGPIEWVKDNLVRRRG